MIENALRGSKKYWTWVFFLLAVIFVGFLFYLRQYHEGLGITGLSRDVTWGFYIAQLTFLVGVAASAVMVVLPYYLHNYKAFGKITILGEFLAISSVIMCMLFVVVDIGQPSRLFNIFLHPTPNSMLFWDTVVLSGYLVLNVLISIVTLGAERKGIAPPRWIRPVIIFSIPWAVSIHTVTAFLYAGLGARPFWMTAILAPRFLASAFAAGPALLILLVLLMRKITKFHVGDEPIKKLTVIVTYAMIINVFFVLMEFFTAFYSAMPEHVAHFQYMYFGLEGNNNLVPWMWTSVVLSIFALVILIVPKFRYNFKLLPITCVAVFIGLWIDKGIGLIITGFVPSVLGEVVSYKPTFPEIMITIAIYAVGALLVTVFYKVALTVRGEVTYDRVRPLETKAVGTK
ncbi:MAG: menaquinol oxidoreductase [candidate division Zixibacteria bacterium]|nr:menaquinol oxidoreductase [candidate division Zixibacteria bacterium]NIR65031.1 menaquinol oxidoreductase [candidate division Zixibacteria bacterium]NIS16991.1 menaquinol oxidoreductase [candidate division Zixibacteria bacterium]NIS46816.1 menaquinol oxidoreductase [candidate division Zixibacteria bacterium]NIT53362.1 menaquinol oxidoreductase [candidate division Zixibacteria bacterium]